MKLFMDYAGHTVEAVDRHTGDRLGKKLKFRDSFLQEMVDKLLNHMEKTTAVPTKSG